ncbi:MULTISPECIES: DUF4258 domain-containing protein [Methylobacter]
MHSQRFNKFIHLTEHAQKRMIERDISMELLIDLIETGALSYKDDKHAWIAKFYQHRTDNLLCAAVVIDQTVIVKTVMYHFSFENEL